MSSLRLFLITKSKSYLLNDVLSDKTEESLFQEELIYFVCENILGRGKEERKDRTKEVVEKVI